MCVWIYNRVVGYVYRYVYINAAMRAADLPVYIKVGWGWECIYLIVWLDVCDMYILKYFHNSTHTPTHRAYKQNAK